MAVKTSWNAGDVLTAADLTDTFAAKAPTASPDFTGDVDVLQSGSTTKSVRLSTQSDVGYVQAANWGTAMLPLRLDGSEIQFYTGATSGVSRGVIDQNKIELSFGGTNESAIFRNTNASFAGNLMALTSVRAANSAYYFGFFYSSITGTPDTEFAFRGDGNGYCDGSWFGGGADYAEYFEWEDGNPTAEDRRGIAVTLTGDKIKPAQLGDTIIGVISGNPSVVGDGAWNKWAGKHLRDDFGSYILDDNGDRILNPEYDPEAQYVSREQRPEWGCVGLMGKLRLRTGQPTDPRWIKMRDVSDSVEEWLVR